MIRNECTPFAPQSRNAAAAKISKDWKFARRNFPRIGNFLRAAVLGLVLPLAVSAAVVRDVQIKQRGDVPVDPGSVLAYTSVKVGADVVRNDLTLDVKALEKSGRFTFVAAMLEEMADGIRVIYEVQPKPRIERIDITGADDIGNKKVRELLELGAGDLVDDETMAFKSIKVKDHYAKKYYPNTKLTWTIDVDKVTGLAVVRVKVEEGSHAKVRRIVFTGNDSIKEDVLRKAMKQDQRTMWSWISGSGTYHPDDLAADRETLRRLFQDHGLLDVAIGEPEIVSVGANAIDIVIPVTEGRKYALGKIVVNGVTLFTNKPDDVLQVVTNHSGDVASMGRIESTAKAIKSFYGNRGYISTQVRQVLTPTADGAAVDVSYEVSEGRKAFIRDVLLRGNTVTKDVVIRRELAIAPGEEYSEGKVRTSENRLRNLGYFKFVNSVPEETADPSQYDLAFELEEQRTGNLMVGAGFSSIDNLIGFVELSQGNFDLFNWPPVGGGEKLKLRGTIGSKRKDVELSFVEPWFLDRKLALGVDLFRHDQQYLSSEYNQKNIGANLSLGKALGNFNRVNLIYGIESYDIYNVSTNASQTIKDEEGSRLKSSLTLELVRDTRNSVFIPTRGMRTSVSAELAGGPLGADTDLYKFEAQASKYWSPWMDHVFNIHGWWASVQSYGDGDRVPIFDRLFLGGARTMRGFKYRGVGPKDSTGEPVGGLTGGYLTFEYTIPVVEKIRFASFYDVGMVYPDAFDNSWNNLNSDWGIGVRFDIPGFPMRLDYAWPIDHDAFNDRKSGRFQFSLGYAY